jgi:DHA3 family tetracycline resistance protein-like MFS transporter
MRMRGAASAYLFLKGASSLFMALVYTVELIYQAQTVGLNPFQLVLAGTVQQVVSILGQAPTGVLADTYSRRWAIVLGLALTGGGYLVEGLIPVLASVLVAQALVGLGTSMMDGADTAWIADELGTEQAGPLYLRATQIGWIATLPGIVLSAALGSIHLNLPIALGGGLLLMLAAILAWIMPERQFSPAARGSRTGWQQMGHTLRAGTSLVRRQPVLRSIVGSGVLLAMFGAGFGRLWQYHLLHHFAFPALGTLKPIVWFGVIEMVIAITSAVGIEIARRHVSTTSHSAMAWALCAVNGLTMGGALLFALAGQFALALAALWLVTTAQGPRIPLEEAWMNQMVESSVRATVFSLRGLAQDLAQILAGPLLGAMATALSTPPALAASALFLAPTLLLYARAARIDLQAEERTQPAR